MWLTYTHAHKHTCTQTHKHNTLTCMHTHKHRTHYYTCIFTHIHMYTVIYIWTNWYLFLCHYWLIDICTYNLPNSLNFVIYCSMCILPGLAGKMVKLYSRVCSLFLDQWPSHTVNTHKVRKLQTTKHNLNLGIKTLFTISLFSNSLWSDQRFQWQTYEIHNLFTAW